ncbi:hypothetical protein GIB67_022006, partial [Kingdonia uniflora]
FDFKKETQHTLSSLINISSTQQQRPISESCCEFTHEGSQRDKMKMKRSWKGCNASVLKVVGDDLLMSNPKRIEKAIGKLTCNALLLKEIMVLPTGANSFEEAMQIGSETYHYLKVISPNFIFVILK